MAKSLSCSAEVKRREARFHEEMRDAKENRRLSNVEREKANRLPEGKRKQEHRRNAQAHEDSAHSSDWRDSNLHKPT